MEKTSKIYYSRGARTPSSNLQLPEYSACIHPHILKYDTWYGTSVKKTLRDTFLPTKRNLDNIGYRTGNLVNRYVILLQGRIIIGLKLVS